MKSAWRTTLLASTIHRAVQIRSYAAISSPSVVSSSPMRASRLSGRSSANSVLRQIEDHRQRLPFAPRPRGRCPAFQVQKCIGKISYLLPFIGAGCIQPLADGFHPFRAEIVGFFNRRLKLQRRCCLDLRDTPDRVKQARQARRLSL